MSLEDIPICGASKGSLVCLKEQHRGRHLFRPTPHVPPPRSWSGIDFIEIETGLIRNPTARITVGDVVGVIGKQGDWRVIRIEQHTESMVINVEVKAPNTGHSHVYRVEDIRYRRPIKVKQYA